LIQTNRGIGYTFTCVNTPTPPAIGRSGREDRSAAAF
jgi:hypothetical protein